MAPPHGPHGPNQSHELRPAPDSRTAGEPPDRKWRCSRRAAGSRWPAGGWRRPCESAANTACATHPRMVERPLSWCPLGWRGLLLLAGLALDQLAIMPTICCSRLLLGLGSSAGSRWREAALAGVGENLVARPSRRCATLSPTGLRPSWTVGGQFGVRIGAGRAPLCALSPGPEGARDAILCRPIRGGLAGGALVALSGLRWRHLPRRARPATSARAICRSGAPSRASFRSSAGPFLGSARRSIESLNPWSGAVPLGSPTRAEPRACEPAPFAYKSSRQSGQSGPLLAPHA